jgi:F-type H+-transporting ATPase subunit gamma
MASLKEVRGRITSVTSTRKITSAMKLVSAAKLRRAQDAIASYLPFQQKLTTILEEFITSSSDLSIPLAAEREVKKVAIVAISSNGSLCGAFNSNVIKKIDELIEQKYSHIPMSDISIYPIGKKVSETFSKKGYEIKGNYDPVTIIEKPEYEQITGIANELIDLFLQKDIDCVELVYNHFKNAAIQQITYEMYLPMVPSATDQKDKRVIDYILEPDKETLINKLVPTVMHLRLYSALLDSITAEHGARMTAMQTATDNAEDLINELKLKYNKARQESITKEILDIVGGAEGLRS